MRMVILDLNGSTTNERILSSALEVFSHKGYADATINAIAKRAHVNNLTIFRHFTDKKMLFLSVVERFKEIYVDVSEFDSLVTFENTEKDISALAHEYFITVFKNIHILRIFIGESCYFNELKERAWFIPAVLKVHFENYLNRLFNIKHLTQENTDMIAEMFVAYVVRRALEYNKHQSIWKLSPEMLNDFDENMKKQTQFMLTILN